MVNTYKFGQDRRKLMNQMTPAIHSVVRLPMRGRRGFIMAMYLGERDTQ